MNFNEFLGRNLGRIKLGKDYLLIITFSLTAISTLSTFLILAGIEFSFYIFVGLFLIVIFLSWLFGYVVDKKKILSNERKTMNLPNLDTQVIIWNNLMEKVFKENIKQIQKEAFKEALIELGKEGYY